MTAVGVDLPALTARLNVLFKRALAVESTIRKIAEANENVNVREVNQWNEDVRAELQSLEQAQNELQTVAEQQDREIDKTILLEKLKRQNEQYAKLVVSLRKANLAFKHNAEQRVAREREQLLSGGSKALEERQRLTSEALIRTTATVTESMRRTYGLLHAEVDRSAQTYQTLESSSKLLGETQNEHKTMSSAINSSKSIVSQLTQRDWVDWLLIYLGIAVLVLVVVYIVKSRLLPSASVDL